MQNPVSRALSFLLSIPVWIYRGAVSPFLPPSCRHVPSCSVYMLDALRLHGPVRGFFMGIDRILRCRPGGTHGYDPVPRFRFRRYKTLKRFPSGNRLKN